MQSEEPMTKPQKLIIRALSASRSLRQAMEVQRQAEASRELAGRAQLLYGYMRDYPDHAPKLRGVLDYEQAFAFAAGKFSHVSTVEEVNQLHELRSAANNNLLWALKDVIDKSEWRELEKRLAMELDEAERTWLEMVFWGLDVATKIQDAHTELRRGRASDACKLASDAIEDVLYKYAEVVPDPI